MAKQLLIMTIHRKKAEKTTYSTIIVLSLHSDWSYLNSMMQLKRVMVKGCLTSIN